MAAARSITWEAPEHHHVERGNDWYFALIIIVLCGVIAALLFGDVLFALLIGFAGGALLVSAAKGPVIIPYAVTARGVRIGGRLYPYSTLLSYHIEEDDPAGPQLLIKSDRTFMPLLVLPLPGEDNVAIERLLSERLEEEELQEPLLVKVLEVFGV